MLVNQNRVLLVVIAVAVGYLVNMPKLKLKDPMMKAGVFAAVLYLAYWFLNSQGLVEGLGDDGLSVLGDDAVQAAHDVANYDPDPAALAAAVAADKAIADANYQADKAAQAKANAAWQKMMRGAARRGDDLDAQIAASGVLDQSLNACPPGDPNC